MTSKLTELTLSSPSAPPPSVLWGSGIFSKLASSGHFDPSQTYDGNKEVEVLVPACTKFSAKGKDFSHNYNPRSSKCHFFFLGKKPCHHTGLPASNIRSYLWSKNDWPFGKELPVSKAPTPDGTSGYSNLTVSRQRDVARWTNVGGPIYSSSEVQISRVNTEGVVKRIRQISISPPDPDAEGSDKLDGEEVEVVHNSVGHQSSTSPSHPPSKRFQSHIIPRTPKPFQPSLATNPTSLPPDSPISSTTRPALIPSVWKFPHSHL
ncbi:hypothetical protein O181_054911 [Austropuccinia psidii MF-1]|uniref:Uncharacterized protein n=1 Tax=Austropuccinia psidii MF-1 TaxID=1389203 RepID=A0A9Q3EAB2_9BASI|nr:hypothetical protein [Austropuccinia psidii MF-1]